MSRRKVAYRVYLDPDISSSFDQIVSEGKRSGYFEELLRRDLESKEAFAEIEARKVVDQNNNLKAKYGRSAEEIVAASTRQRENIVLEGFYRELGMDSKNLIRSVKSDKSWLLERAEEWRSDNKVDLSKEEIIKYCLRKAGAVEDGEK